jgi:hypothetical protein
LIVSVQLTLQRKVALAEVEPAIKHIVERELAAIDEFTAKLAQGQLPVW